MKDVSAINQQISEWLRPDTLVGAIAYLVLFCLIASLLARALGLGIRTALRHPRREHLDPTAMNFLRQLGVLVIWIFVLTLYAHLIPPLRALGTALLAGASVASIVLGLAAQSTLGNLVAGISILIYRPFRLGDVLQISTPTGTEVGTVVMLSLGYTILGTQDERHVIVPNSLAISQVVVNLNAGVAKALTLNFWAQRSELLEARGVALDFAQQLGAEVLGCFVTKSEVAAAQVSLMLRALSGQGPAAGGADLAQRLSDALQSGGIHTPAGKPAPTLT
jgi:small-conductance mechanosensitive channel